MRARVSDAAPDDHGHGEVISVVGLFVPHQRIPKDLLHYRDA